jgi:sulfoxide reductase heme-binding subunit YedZ
MSAALVADKTLWYTARGTGIVTVMLLTASVALGIVTVLRWKSPRFPRFVTAGLHKNVSLLAVVFLGVHILSTVLDSVSPVHLLNAIVPFTGSYRPLGIGLGVVAFDLLAALVVSSLLRNQIGRRAWRAIHWSAYACWPFAMLHGITAGSDVSAPWVRAIYASCCAVVFAAVAWRVSAVQPSRAPLASARS